MTKKYNVLLPVAGRAQRFLDRGYTMPKPLIMANTRHVIDWAMDSFKADECNLIFAVRLDHIHNFSIDQILKDKFGEYVKDDIKQGIVFSGTGIGDGTFPVVATLQDGEICSLSILFK